MLFTKFNINTTLCPQNNGDRQFVRIRVSSHSSRIDLYTGISLTKKQWDGDRQRVKHGCLIGNTMYNILNSALETQKQFIRDYFAECAYKDMRPSLSVLHKKFNKKFK